MSQISIILPTYNVEKYITRALESCINQTFKDIEIIVVDDCGSDKSIDIAKEYASKDDRIKIIHNEENLKLLKARYEGVKVATSPYIMFLDPDDYLELNACKECVKIIDKQKVDLICFNYYECDDSKKEWIFFESAFYNNENFCYFLFSKYPKFSWNIFNKMLKKELYLKAFNTIGLQPNEKNTMAEDFLLVLHSLKFLNTIGTTKQYLYNYNIANENSSTREKKDLNRIKSYIHDLSFVLEKISNLTQNQTNKLHSLIFKIAIYDLNIHKIDLTYKHTNRIFFKKIFLKIQRKKIKIKKNIQIKVVKNLKNQ
ncbi:glycosyltransferase [Campylobacter lari]|uniref:glycosyltransferase family 2 protein n=1 Tax=Campylobacter lari TaxID=201 RepID=UPI0012BE3F46|nr:glycosyltransferase family 2 protein [Campylobacter lari]EAM0941166.1 glycosyltransferase family 2 protein [Campylobacter lari]EGK8061563.1 glycosyltransferase family 2 protein [Campylobacter lari]EGO9780370.1 glycosyltransferase family 2 protein [Campylobacter lari]EJN1896418.1 glycosyltransferase family 2 protein [Campylobacter lari]EJS0897487.1 glycosyltransferase family 2 protein [Campylobacter lari]